MLRWRLLLGTLVVAVLVGLCWLDHQASTPGVWLAPVLIVFGILGVQETLDLLATAGIRPTRWIVHVGSLLVLASPWFLGAISGTSVFGVLAASPSDSAAARLSPWAAAGLAGVVFVLAAIAVFLGEMARYEKAGGAIANIAGGLFAIGYVGLFLSFAVQIRMFWGISGLLAMIAVVKMGDTGAYTVGRLVGRHKMSPKISPGKTWEGAGGALLFSLATAWASFTWLLPPTTPGDTAAHPLAWVLFGVVVCVAGLLGDLAESLLKRDTGRKDSSTWLPGFGGILDMLDSILFASPIAYLLYAILR
jgi:phosphatidate cytidylyltransferase